MLVGTGSIRHRFSGKAGAACSGAKSFSVFCFPTPILARKERVEGRVLRREYIPNFTTISLVGLSFPVCPGC